MIVVKYFQYLVVHVHVRDMKSTDVLYSACCTDSDIWPRLLTLNTESRANSFTAQPHIRCFTTLALSSVDLSDLFSVSRPQMAAHKSTNVYIFITHASLSVTVFSSFWPFLTFMVLRWCHLQLSLIHPFLPRHPLIICISSTPGLTSGPV